MRIISFLLIFSFLLSTNCTHGQADLTAADWQADLLFLQQTVHTDYPFLFKKITTKEFDAEVEKVHKAIPNLERHEIISEFARLVSSFGYGHTTLGMRGSPANFHSLPFNLYHFSDGVFIQGVHKDYEKALGAEVVAVEGMPITEALAAVRPVVPVENDQYFKAFGTNYLRIPELLHARGITNKFKNDITLQLKKEGKMFTQTFSALQNLEMPIQYSLIKKEGDWLDVRDQNVTPLYLKHLDKIYYYEYLPEQKTVYVRHSQIQDDPTEAIPAFYEKVFDFIEKNEVEKLVLDVRLNGGGNNYKNKPIVTGVIQSKKINQPGKFFVIIGRRTFSACQNLVNELHNYTNAIFVGEPTSENINFYGDNRKVVLPKSNLSAYLSFAWWQDKPQWENEPWLAPHLAVDMSFDQFKNNQDPVLETVLNFSEDHFILDPMAYFTDLFMNKKLDVLEAEAKRMVRDPMYRFFNFEDQFNRAGYNLLRGNQIDEALYVFQMNTKFFPESANVWDSFGEVHWKANKIEKAIKYYNKAIALDPDGDIGENARNMIRQIKNK